MTPRTILKRLTTELKVNPERLNGSPAPDLDASCRIHTYITRGRITQRRPLSALTWERIMEEECALLASLLTKERD